MPAAISTSSAVISAASQHVHDIQHWVNGTHLAGSSSRFF